MQKQREQSHLFLQISSDELNSHSPQDNRIPQTINEKVIQIKLGSRNAQQNHLMIYYLHVLERQLPNMPHHHLISTLFSNRHQTLLLASFDNDAPIEILGGLTFCKIFANTAFQITFMASSSIKKGYGSKLIDHFKNFSQAQKIGKIFTHADNNAIQFYKKNGFIKLKESYRQLQEPLYINSTLMYCQLNYKQSYQDLRNQMKFYSQRLRTQIKQKMISSQLGQCYRPKEIKSDQECFIVDNQYFNINPKQLERDLAKNEFRKLREARQQKVYINFTFYIDRLISIACGRVIEIEPRLKQLSILEYEEPIDLKTLRDRAAAGDYNSSSDFFSDIKRVFINTRKLYRDDNQTIDNIDKLYDEMKELEKESEMVQDK